LFILDHNFWTRNARQSIKRSKAQKTQTWAKFPMKTSAKYFGLAVGP